MPDSILSVCWNITPFCNLSCGYCYRDKHTRSLSREHWPTVIEKLRVAGVRRLAIAGGEPLLVDGIDELIGMAAGAGLLTALITNGSLLSLERIPALARTLHEISFSIDGDTPERHATMRGASTALLPHLFDCLERLRDTPVRRRVNSVVTRQNLDSIARLGPELVARGVDEWRLMQFFPLHDAVAEAHRFVISEGEFHELVLAVRAEIGPSICVSEGSNSAMSGSYFVLGPDGTVYTSAPGRTFVLGQVLTDDFEAMGAAEAFSQTNHRAQYHLVPGWRS